MQTQRREGFVKRLMKKSSNMRHFHHHKANKNTITFHFKLDKPVEDYAGEIMLISGSIPELGNGSIANAARMYPLDTPEGRVWKYDLVVPVKELEHARMDIAGTYEGNPHGNFFTYNYVVKKPEEKGAPAIEKYESVPRRGVPKSSLMSTNSLGEQVFLNDYTIDHTWSSTSTPNSVVVSKKELSSNDSLGSKIEVVTPAMMGKAESSPMSPSSSRPRATTLATDSIPRMHENSATLKPLDRSVSASMIGISQKDQEILDELKAQLDEPKKKGMFSWYKNLNKSSNGESTVEKRTESIYSPETERMQRYMREASAQSAQPVVLVQEEEPISIIIDDPLPAIPVRSTSPEERRAEEQKIIENQINLRTSYGSYQQSFKSEEAAEVKAEVPEMVRIEDEPENFIAPQFVASERDLLEHDPLMTAVDPELKQEKFDFNASIEELEQKVIANLKDAEVHRSFSQEATSTLETPMKAEDSLFDAPVSSEVYNYSDEVSEDALLERIEENTPLLAPLDSQLPDIEDSEVRMLSRSDVVDFSDYVEEPSEVSDIRTLPVGSVDPILFGKVHRLNKEILAEASKRTVDQSVTEYVEVASAEPSSWTSFGIDAVLSGKMYRVGQELKQKIGAGWSNFLQSRRDIHSSIRSFEPVDAIVSGKLHNVHRELISKVAGKSVEDRNDWLSTRQASSMPTQSVDPITSGKLHNVHKELLSKIAGKSTESRNEWLSTRRNSSTPASEPVDPIISGKMHKVHLQLKQKLPVNGRLSDFFGFVPRSMSFNGINPIISGKMNKVHQQITSMIPKISAISFTPSIFTSGVPEITIKDESIKSMSVFEEQMEKELRHRRIHKDQKAEVSSPVTTVGKVNAKDLKNVGYHTVRNDFMPISHSESMIASDVAPLAKRLLNKNPAGIILMFSVFLWILLYSIYFPESMLVVPSNQ